MTHIPVNNLQAVIAGICAASYIYFAAYIISPAFKDKRFRPLFYLCVLAAFWCFSYIMFYLSVDSDSREFWQRFTFAGMISFVFSLWFFISFSGLIKNKKLEKWLLIAIWIPFLIVAYKSISGNAVAKDFPANFWFLFAEILTTCYNLTSMVFLISYYSRNNANKTRRQKIILASSGLVLMTLSWLSDYYYGFRNGQNLMPFWLLVWIGIILFTIKKYRFIGIMPEFIGKDITENIEEGIILLDPELKIISVNRAMREILNAGSSESFVREEIFFENHILDDEFRKLEAGEGVSFRTRINLKSGNNGKKIPADLKIKKITDAYKDMSGYLIIVSKVRDIGYLRTQYGISVRETDVIRQLALGKSYKEIARILSISESTIESHAKNIYNKIGINNRIELLNLLFEFALSNPPERNLYKL